MDELQTKCEVERILMDRGYLIKIEEFQSLGDMGFDSIDIIGLETDIETQLGLPNPNVKTGWLRDNDTIDTILTKIKYWKP